MGIAISPSIDPKASTFVSKTAKILTGGKWSDAASGKTFDTYNPATGEVLARVAEGDREDIDRAVKAARKAFDGPWSRMTASDRGKLIWKLADLLEQHLEEFATLETLDNGKPLTISRVADVPLAVDMFRYMAGWATKIEGTTIPISVPYAPGAKFLAYTRREPVGVVGQIIPWNFPLLMAAWKLGPALATGNTAVLKPAETTPLTALLLAEICQEADLPAGVVDVLTGDGSAGADLVRSGLDKVAFTGSPAVGKEIQRALAGTGTGLTLELGGKSANIVFEDAALDQAVEGIIEGIFFNQGHVCCAGSRLLLQESVAEEVTRKLWARMERLRVGDPLDKNTDVGAINSAAQLARIEALVEEGEREGATRRSVACVLPETGYWFPPTLFLDVAPANRIAVEEIFGPVVSVTTFRTPAEAVERANNSAYGLAAGVWTDNGSKAFEVASALRAGVVWQNTYNRFDPTAAFGGYKESGFGREGGPAGLLPYVRLT